MDHWLAMDDLSRGLHDETTCVTFRDLGADVFASQGVHDKSAVHVCIFLINLKALGEELEYCNTDGARELARACIEFRIAHDPTIPGNRKLMAVAERPNGVVQMGTRALLMQAGLSPPFGHMLSDVFAVAITHGFPRR
eukprot:8446891-Pyramimonas_sp.AAC.1